MEKYQDLKIEIGRLWKLKMVEVVPVVIGALGSVTKGFDRWIEKLGIPLNGGVMQKTTLLGITRILRKVLKMWRRDNSVSLCSFVMTHLTENGNDTSQKKLKLNNNFLLYWGINFPLHFPIVLTLQPRLHVAINKGGFLREQLFIAMKKFIIIILQRINTGASVKIMMLRLQSSGTSTNQRLLYAQRRQQHRHYVGHFNLYW